MFLAGPDGNKFCILQLPSGDPPAEGRQDSSEGTRAGQPDLGGIFD